MSTKELSIKVKEIKELTRMKEELEAEISSIQDEIKTVMTEQNVDELVTNEYKIRWKEVESKRFDTTAFKQKYLDLYNQFTKCAVCRRFTIA